jgi:hypothetical protein
MLQRNQRRYHVKTCLRRQFLRKVWSIQLAFFVCLCIATYSATVSNGRDIYRFMILLVLHLRLFSWACVIMMNQSKVVSLCNISNTLFVTVRNVSFPQKSEAECPSIVCCPQLQMYYTRISFIQVTSPISPSARYCNWFTSSPKIIFTSHNMTTLHGVGIRTLICHYYAIMNRFVIVKSLPFSKTLLLEELFGCVDDISVYIITK